MRATSRKTRRALWARHDRAWREPAQVATLWREAGDVDPALLQTEVQGAWWDILATADMTLLVTREYEHLVLALSADGHGPAASYMSVPHPSGLAVDRERGTVYLASTRNPNQILDLKPVTCAVSRADTQAPPVEGRPLLPVRSRFFPGCLYMHDLALIAGALHVTAAGQNAVARVGEQGEHDLVWWPRCIDTPKGPAFNRNHIQLNSIAAGSCLKDSFFTASATVLGRRVPGDRNFQVDGRGVIFSGATRDPVTTGLTRPHSARLHAGRLWVNNSGYGELVCVTDGGFETVARLPGWTRGLCFSGDIAFVGTSRVIPRFRGYAPGLHVKKSICGVHAIDTRSGRVLGSVIWPFGNQIFALEPVSRSFTTGFAFQAGERPTDRRTTALFYTFRTAEENA